MNLYLCGLSGITDILESFESTIWNVQFFECGDFQLICPYSDALYQLLEPGKYLVRETDIIQGDEFHNVMEISKRIITFDPEKGWRLEVSGSGLKKIIGQRVIWNQTNFEQENVETAIRQVITDNIIDPVDPDRKINNFILADAIGFADVFDAQLFSENLSEWMTSVCTMYGYGWDVYIKNGKYVFALIEGTDRSFESDDPVIFSEEFEMLMAGKTPEEIMVFMDENEKTLAENPFARRAVKEKKEEPKEEPIVTEEPKATEEKTEEKEENN